MTEKKIPYEGIYWWSDAGNVIDPLNAEIKRILNSNRITSIEFTGSDFNDGKEHRKITIRVNESKNTIEISEWNSNGYYS